MRLLIAGSRSINDYELVKKHVDKIENISLIISGGAKGVDTLAETYAEDNNIPIQIFKPDWSIGKSAGYIRNKEMWENCDQGIVFWDGVSKGTQHSFKLAKQLNKNITIINGSDNQ